MVRLGILAGTALAAAALGYALFGSTARGPDRDIPALLSLKPAFAEEFDGDRLDTSLWRTNFAGKGEPDGLVKRTLWGNGERQVYTDGVYLGIDPFRIANGTLTIVANPLPAPAIRAVRAEYAKLPGAQRDSTLAKVSYSSGLISSRGRFAQRHGFFEIRARWSGGKGLWPAFWLLPAHGGWPPEFDIMEAHGDKPEVIFQSRHSEIEDSVTKRVPVPGGTGDWHRYGLMWTPDTLRFYVDGYETTRLTPPPDADGPMYLLANLAVGGKWPGDPDGSTRFPATMEIDWIRAYPLPRGWQEQRLEALGD